jgi:Domain of Unknown Function (DUF928)
MKLHFSIKFVSTALVLTVLLQNALLYPVHAEPSVLPDEPQTLDALPSQGALKFIAPLSQRPYPGQRSPGKGRDICPLAAVPLTVLMPSLPNGRKLDTWGQTHQERPLVWVYVPYGSEDKRPDNRKNKFELQLEIREDAPGRDFVQHRVPLPSQGKIMPIELPPDYKLEVGKNYHVQVRATCTSMNAQQANFWIQRMTAPTDLSQVPTPSRDRVKRLAEQGIWLDTLTEVVKVNAAPKLSAEWQTFVQESLGWDLQESTAIGREEKAKVEKILKEPIN